MENTERTLLTKMEVLHPLISKEFEQGTTICFSKRSIAFAWVITLESGAKVTYSEVLSQSLIDQATFKNRFVDDFISGCKDVITKKIDDTIKE